MIVGAIKPTLLLPELELSTEQLSLVFWHELIHYRRWANRSFLGKMYQSSLRRMVASLVESRDLTDRDLAELEEFIAGQRRAREEERS